MSPKDMCLKEKEVNIYHFPKSTKYKDRLCYSSNRQGLQNTKIISCAFFSKETTEKCEPPE